MAITTSLCNSFKQEVLAMTPHTAADVYKIALIKVGATGTYNASTTSAGTPGTGAPSSSNLGTDEVTGTGYTTGGATLATFTTSLDTNTAILDFTVDPTWATSTISAIGAIIYNSSRTNKAVAVFDFGGTITSTAGTFTATLPAATAAAGLIRY
jgi:hypothetical protein